MTPDTDTTSPQSDASREPAGGGPAEPFTPGPYLRVNATVYALTETGGWRNGAPDMCNRFTAFVQSGVRCRLGEDEATAQLFSAAPDLYAALVRLDAFWTADHPAGPENPKRRTFGELSDETVSIWTQIRQALARANPSPDPAGADGAATGGGAA